MHAQINIMTFVLLSLCCFFESKQDFFKVFHWPDLLDCANTASLFHLFNHILEKCRLLLVLTKWGLFCACPSTLALQTVGPLVCLQHTQLTINRQEAMCCKPQLMHIPKALYKCPKNAPETQIISLVSIGQCYIWNKA